MTTAPVVEPNATFALEPQGPFSLEAAARFWGGFTPASHAGLHAQGHLHMAFPVEGDWTAIGVCVREIDGSIQVEVYGDVDVDAVRRQIARILSLDVDGRALAEVGRRDPVAADLLRRFQGLRPVCFYSTYEAAVWAILSQRVQMRQAARVQERLRESLGELIDIHAEPMRAFPPPARLIELAEFPGVFASKIKNLHGIARAALAGELDAAYLRALPDAEALARLQTLRGIGPFGAELILLRGAGHPDYLTLHEPRFRRAVQDAYGFDHTPTDDDLRCLSDAWRPYRMWVTFLLRQSSSEH